MPQISSPGEAFLPARRTAARQRAARMAREEKTCAEFTGDFGPEEVRYPTKIESTIILCFKMLGHLLKAPESDDFL